MFNVVDTAFCYGRALIACLFLWESFKGEVTSLHEIRNADTAFFPSRTEVYHTSTLKAELSQWPQ